MVVRECCCGAPRTACFSAPQSEQRFTSYNNINGRSRDFVMETGMSSGEFVTRSTIWIAIAAYTLGCVVFATPRRHSDGDRWARLAWTTGCAALVAHFLSAFHFYHAWSQASAYSDTARQTAEV